MHHSKFRSPMSALGQKQTSRHFQPMSALPPKADIGTRSRNVRFWHKADITERDLTTSSLQVSLSKTASSQCRCGRSSCLISINWVYRITLMFECGAFKSGIEQWLCWCMHDNSLVRLLQASVGGVEDEVDASDLLRRDVLAGPCQPC